VSTPSASSWSALRTTGATWADDRYSAAEPFEMDLVG
jgi:hypothetical protein